MAKRLWSIFTDDMDKCIITHAMTGIERHHIFGGTDRCDENVILNKTFEWRLK